MTATETADSSTWTDPPAFIAWQRVPDRRGCGRWTIAAYGATEAEALSAALSRPTGLKHRDLLVLPGDQGGP